MSTKRAIRSGALLLQGLRAIYGSDKLIKGYQGILVGIALQLRCNINSPRMFCWEHRVFVCLVYDNSDYKEIESGTKHPFVPSSRSPSHAFYMRPAFSVIAGMFGIKPTIEWLPTLSPQLVGSAFSDYYLGGQVARLLNGLPHEPLLDPYRTVRAPRIDRLQNICHRVDANASFVDGRFWTSDAPSHRYTWSVRTYM